MGEGETEYRPQDFIQPETPETERYLGDEDIVPYNPENDTGSIFIVRPDISFRMFEPASVKNAEGKLESNWEYQGVTMYSPEDVLLTRDGQKGQLETHSVPIEEFKQLNDHALLSPHDVFSARVKRTFSFSSIDNRMQAPPGSDKSIPNALDTAIYPTLSHQEQVPPGMNIMELADEQVQRGKTEKEIRNTTEGLRVLQIIKDQTEKQEKLADRQQAEQWISAYQIYLKRLQQKQSEYQG